MKYIYILILNIIICQQTISQNYTKTDQLFWISSIWKDVKENFYDPKKLESIKWDNLYLKSLEEINNTNLSDANFYLLCVKFISSLEDGHSEFNANSFLFKSNQREYDFLPLEIGSIDGRFYTLAISKYYVNDIPLGSEVIKINGIPTFDYINQVCIPFSTGSTPGVRMNSALQHLTRGPFGDSLRLEIKTPMQQIVEKHIRFEAIKKSLSKNDLVGLKQSSIHKKSENSIGLLRNKSTVAYLRFDNFALNEVSPLVIENKEIIKQADYIILDLRNNPGGSELIADTLLMCFLNIDTLKTYKSITRKSNAFYTAMGYGYKEYKDYYKSMAVDTLPENIFLKKNLPYFSQPLVILISAKTCSAAEDLLFPLKLHYPNRAILVGTPTAGSTGAPLVRTLPHHNTYYRICTRKPLLPQGIFENGIQPDFYYEKSLEEYKTDDDLIFEFVNNIRVYI